MRPDASVLGTRKRAVRELEGLRPLCRRTGLELGVIRSAKEGRDLRVSSLVALADAFGWVLQLRPTRPAVALPEDREGQDAAPVPDGIVVMDVDGAAQPGGDIAPRQIGLPASVLNQAGVSPSAITARVVSGDAMAPLVPDGAVVVLDLSGEPGPNGTLVAIERQGSTHVRRTLLVGNMTALVADNLAHRTTANVIADVPSTAFRVLGRVLFVLHDTV